MIFTSSNFFYNDYNVGTYYKVKHNEDNIILSFVAPGFKREDFSIESRFDKLYVSIPEQRQKTIRLPDNIDASDISAEYVAGILEVRLGLKEFKKKTIEIK